MIDSPATLAWLDQVAALDLHVPQWRIERPAGPTQITGRLDERQPDRVVFDQDPERIRQFLSRSGTSARLAGRLSSVALGALCRAKLEQSLVDLSASVSAVEPATLAIARLDSAGAPYYEFYTDGTADWAWTDRSLAPLIDDPSSSMCWASSPVHRNDPQARR